MEKIYNFSAEQSTPPAEVLEKWQKDFTDMMGVGADLESVLKTKSYASLYTLVQSAVREILSVPENYRVFLCVGSGAEQYAAIPQNLLSGHRLADYILTGSASKAAYEEAKKYGDIAIAASSGGALPPFSSVPNFEPSDIRPDADYVYICYNDRAFGTRFRGVPDTGNIPLVADMTGVLFSEPFDISKFGLLFASGDVNLTLSGMTVVIVRDDLIGSALPTTPSSMNYATLCDLKTGVGLPSAFLLTTALETLIYMKDAGGLDEFKRRTERKSSMLYDYLDGQIYYITPIDKQFRSYCNVIFTTGSRDMDERFLKTAESEGLFRLGGGPTGGICASLYNTMPTEGVEALISVMKKFSYENPKIEI